MSAKIRNVAIIAHVDHGKTTLVDGLLRQSGTFRKNEAVVERVMDNLDLERERGITILSKNTSVVHNDTLINIVDTPGHSDFGGEVERVLKMVDGVLLLVDASEGPLPGTRFVLRKALEGGLTAIVCINKIDRPDARIQEVVNEVYDLFIDLGADEKQIEFPIVYACARDGVAHRELGDDSTSLQPLFDVLVEHLPPPAGDPAAPLQFLVTNVDYDNYVGRLAIGRIFEGTLRKNDWVVRCGDNDVRQRVKITTLYRYAGLKRVETEEAAAGDILAISGIDELTIGDTVAAELDPKPLPRVKVDEPTIAMVVSVNTSPFAGRDGTYVTSRNIRDRLFRELRGNVAIRVEEMDTPDQFKVVGRGELQLAILVEMMRREGYEMSVSKPEVILHHEGGKTLEPYEILHLDFPDQFMGVVTQRLAFRRGRMAEMKPAGSGRVRVVYRLPSRGLIGFRGEYLTDTRGLGIANTLFDGWDVQAGPITYRETGSLVSDRQGSTTPYAIFHLQTRGKMFVGPGEEVYEGMVVGENARAEDMNLNITREKKLTNIRTTAADEKLLLVPPVQLTLESAIEFIRSDELVEVTPNHLRLRKRVLAANQRPLRRQDD
ncbi:MAG TPA: translational GTPase TypA [Polyangia bacterium]